MTNNDNNDNNDNNNGFIVLICCWVNKQPTTQPAALWWKSGTHKGRTRNITSQTGTRPITAIACCCYCCYYYCRYCCCYSYYCRYCCYCYCHSCHYCHCHDLLLCVVIYCCHDINTCMCKHHSRLAFGALFDRVSAMATDSFRIDLGQQSLSKHCVSR